MRTPVEGPPKPMRATLVRPSVSDPGAAQSARELGWAAFETPVARGTYAGKTRVAVAICALHLVLFQIILSAVYPEEGAPFSGGSGPGWIFLVLALGYVVLAVLVTLNNAAGRIVGYVLVGVSLVLWIPLFAAGPAFTANPQLGWIVAVSIVDALAVIIGLLILRDLAHAPQSVPTA